MRMQTWMNLRFSALSLLSCQQAIFRVHQITSTHFTVTGGAEPFDALDPLELLRANGEGGRTSSGFAAGLLGLAWPTRRQKALGSPDLLSIESNGSEAIGSSIPKFTTKFYKPSKYGWL